ncbi:MAG: hypothetical protein ACLQBB_16215 [Solirubrobacteraceae bacterium]
MRSALLRAALAVVFLVVLGQGAAAQASPVIGIGAENASLFASPWFTGLHVGTVRLDLPWNAAESSGPWDAWLTDAHANGLEVLVALDHDPTSDCPTTSCALVPLDSYRSALAELLERYPFIKAIEPWNEPNDSTEPTAGHPEAAAAYYDAARAVCPSCTLIAGDFLDGPSLDSYLSAYLAALADTPEVWGLHDYYDANYFESAGVATMLAETTGDLWLTETGGLVQDGDLPYDEQRAALADQWVYELAAAHDRIARVYFYGWLASTEPGSFDSGLLEPDGSPRPAYWTIRAYTDPGEWISTSRRASIATARLSHGAATLRRTRRIQLGIACVGATGSRGCVGHVRITAHAHTVTVRFSITPGHVMRLHARLAYASFHTVWTERSPHVQVGICTTSACRPATRLAVHRER